MSDVPVSAAHAPANAAKSLIINSPYERPAQHWLQARDNTLSLVAARRTAGYEIFDIRNNTRRTEPLDLVNAVRERVDTCPATAARGNACATRWPPAAARPR